MSSYTEGQTHQLMNRLETEGFTPAHITKLGQFGNLTGLKSVLDGTATIKPMTEDAARVITISGTMIAVNLGATPKSPSIKAEVEGHIGGGWALIEKRADGLYVNGRKVVLYLSKRQQNGSWLEGHELHKELTGKPILNVNILDALYDNPHLIPEDWKKDEQGNTRFIFFWATIFRRAGGHFGVRVLYFSAGVWCHSCRWLDSVWYGNSPAALLAPSTRA